MKFYLLTAAAAAVAAAAVAAVVVSAAVAYDSGVVSSPYFLWLAANVIVVWLFSSHHRGVDTADVSSAPGADVDIGVYTSSSSSGHDHVFAVAEADLAAAPAVATKKKRSGKASSAAATSAREDTVDATPDVKKSAVEEEWPDWAFFVENSSAAAAENPADAAAVTNPIVNEKEWSAWVLACTSPETNPAPAATVIEEEKVKPPFNEEKSIDDEVVAITAATDIVDDDVSMDSMWESILQRGARPVTVRKSETWAADDRRRRDRAAENAVAAIRKSATATNMTTPPASPQHERAAPPAPARQPWRTRDALPAMPNDELMRRAESLIRRHHEQLRLQRQESEMRRRPLIRV
uniref:DUF4408 domain-containing protein n=1 Tax=Leersia perrieri TaxID=77586 RepID=A0A0D9XKW6_9ORYZ